jgi:ribosomal protein L34E
MVAWHILHSDLPKRLSFVATFTCPWQPAWKHLSGSKPAFYNATDADVEWRAMEVIERELRKSGLWEVYQRDVLDLDPVLVHMQQIGMPVDGDVRLDRAIKLDNQLNQTKGQLEQCFPIATRGIQIVYKKTPQDTTGLIPQRIEDVIRRCSICGLENPTKPHFKTFKKPTEKRPQNPCSGGSVKSGVESVERFARLSEFKPSREQLIRYHQFLKRPLPLTWDKKNSRKKVSFGEKEIKKLILTYPTDPCYNLILTYRSIDKLAGTYVGRPSKETEE